ncbi:MAG: DUF2071 domain-containing protein [Vicinamibacteraceae bacterium]
MDVAGPPRGTPAGAGPGRARRRPFLTARWEHLVLLNYACPAALLAPLVPAGTTLDAWQGQTLVSLVGFRFEDTRLAGIPIPGHRSFDEVNLRFYVRRTALDGSVRRAVVFIRELVPRLAIATIARWLYNEPYLSVPMGHAIDLDPRTGGAVAYRWRHRGQRFTIGASVSGPAQALVPGSEAEFITEHYWGYTRQRDGGTLEYEVIHPRWAVWAADSARFEGAADRLYGPDFAHLLSGAPQSAFVAVGSPVSVFRGTRLDLSAPRGQ